MSEKDDGIYFAMNKALKLATGKVILFVNSGDIISENALKIVHKNFKQKNLDFLFGTVIRNYTKSKILKYNYNLSKIKYNFDFATSHSTGFFLKRKYYKKINYFDTKFKCSADYDLYYKILNNNKLKGGYTLKNQLIGIVASGGFSSKFGYLNIILEECRIRISNKQNFLMVILIFFNNLIKRALKSIFNVYNDKEINQKSFR